MAPHSASSPCSRSTILRLQTLLACFQTAPTRVSKKPQGDPGRFAVGRQLRGFAQSRMKNFLRFRRIGQHQETEAVKLEQILFFFGHPDFLRRECYAPGLDRNESSSGSPIRQAITSCYQTLQSPRHFFSVFAAVERRNADVTFALRAESRAGCDDHVDLVQHSIEHLPTR